MVAAEKVDKKMNSTKSEILFSWCYFTKDKIIIPFCLAALVYTRIDADQIVVGYLAVRDNLFNDYHYSFQEQP